MKYWQILVDKKIILDNKLIILFNLCVIDDIISVILNLIKNWLILL
jgi:hypothetical protein